MSYKFNRRTFLKRSGMAASAIGLPYFVPCSAFGANERIILGFIGTGGQGRYNLKAFGNAAAVCDVDKKHLAHAVKSVQARAGHDSGSCEATTDFRRLLDRQDIDAVVISTPDHWHALQTIEACAAGKDVYCEKPLSLTIGEGRKMVEAARKYQRVVQTGSQQRSTRSFRTACEYVRSGRIGKLREVHASIAPPNFKGPLLSDAKPPKELDYNMWLGPAPWRPYNEKRVHYFFRFYWDYSGGQMTNWGAHDIDIAQWGMNTELTGPIEIKGTGTYDKQRRFEVTTTCHVVCRYANGLTLTVTQKQDGGRGGVRFIGTDGEIYANRGVLKCTPDEILKKPLDENDVHLARSSDHRKNFLDAVATRERPLADVEIGHRSATVCHLANIAIRTGKTVRWDPEQEQFPDDDEANQWLVREYRAPWKLP